MYRARSEFVLPSRSLKPILLPGSHLNTGGDTFCRCIQCIIFETEKQFLMKGISKFISMIELAREQVQYGYFLAGVTRQETSNLAEHHYLVTIIAWMLCEYINREEKFINTDEVIKMCLVHDLGELFGGDMSAPLARKWPDLKQHALAFEQGNFNILMSLLDPAIACTVKDLWTKESEHATDEAVVAKIADLMETHFFLEHRGIQNEQKDGFYLNHIRPLVEKIIHEQIRARANEFFDDFEANIKNKGFTPSQWIME